MIQIICVDCVIKLSSFLGGPVVNVPLDAPRAVADEWRNDSIYNQRLWGSYRYANSTVIEMCTNFLTNLSHLLQV